MSFISMLIIGLKNVSTTIGGLLGIAGTIALGLGYEEEGVILVGAGASVTGIFARSAGKSSKSLGLE